MSSLVILIAPRPRDGPDAVSGVEFNYVLTPDGMTIGSSGRAEPAALPRADSVVAVLGPTDVAWHRVTLPKAPAGRLRQALGSVLEEGVLDEPDDVHLALAPDARAGEPVWVAAVRRGWLTGQLDTLAAGGVGVDRLVPALAPAEAASGHFFTDALERSRGADDLWLGWSDAQGSTSLRAAGSLARAMLPGWSAQAPRWTATPAAAAAAELWLGAAVLVRSDAETALAATRSRWNLRQFELARQASGVRALRDLGRQLTGPQWRPMRWGVAGLLIVHLAGLNAWAWQQRRSIEARRGEMTELLRASHPQVRAVLDAPAQMQRETALLRTAAGRVGDGDFEALLAMTAAAWPEGRTPVEQLRFEPGKLSLPSTGWPPEQLQQLRTRIEAAGGRLVEEGGQLTISRPERGAGAAR